MDGGMMETGTRTFICSKADFGTIQPRAEEKIELLVPMTEAVGGVVKLRIQSPETKTIEPTVRLVCHPETK
jgi:hypothetical protein